MNRANTVNSDGLDMAGLGGARSAVKLGGGPPAQSQAASSLVMAPPSRGLGGMPQPRISHADPPLQNNLGGGGMANPMMEQPGFAGQEFGGLPAHGQPM